MLTNIFWIAGAVIGVVILLLVIRYMSNLYVRVAPNKAAYFFGRNAKKAKPIQVKQPGAPEDAPKVMVLPPGTKVVSGGGRLRLPILEEVDFLDLTLFSLPNIKVHNMPSKEGVLVTVDAVANIKFRNDASSLLAAGARFLGMSREAIEQVARETLEANLRGVVGQLTVEELVHKRDAFREQVMTEAGEDLNRFGMEIDQFNPQTISDEQEYIIALGKKRTAQVQKDAKIGEAQAQAEAKKESTTAEREAEIVAQDNERQEKEAQKNKDVAVQKYNAEVATEKATAGQAGPLADAKARQDVVIEAAKVDEKRLEAEVAVEQQRIEKQKKAQHAQHVVPAKAEADALLEKATGYQKSEVAKAEGDNKAVILKADAEAHKLEAEGAGKAKAISAEGLAEAEVIKSKGLAEAEALLKKAAAYEKFTDAALYLELLREAPEAIKAFAEVMSAVAAPMGNIDKLVMFDGGNGNGKGNKLTNLVSTGPAILSQLMEIAGGVGFDLEGLLNVIKIKSEGSEIEKKPAEEVTAS